MSPRQQEPLSVPVGRDGRLTGTLVHSGWIGPAAVVFVHGFGSTHNGEKAQALAMACGRRGWTFAAVDFRGHGGASGTLLDLSGWGLQADLDALADYLESRGVRRLFLVGSSMGGWASGWFGARHPHKVGALVAIAPAFDFPNRHFAALSEQEVEDWRQTGRLEIRSPYLSNPVIGPALLEEQGQFDLADLARQWAAPLLIFHGIADEVVPWSESLELVQRSPFPRMELRLLKDGDHRLLPWKEEMAEEACRFFTAWWPEA